MQVKISFGLIGSFLLLTAANLYAQMETGLNRDSLKRKLTAMRPDTEKVATLIRLGQQYEANMPDSALYLYAAAGKLSKQLDYVPGVLRFIANYTAVLNVQGRFSESLKLNLSAVNIARKGHLRRQLMKALINTGAVYQYTEHYQQAVSYYLQALPLLDSIGTSQERSLAYGNLCGLYRNLKQPQSALGYARLALLFGEQQHDDYAIASACINLGNCLKDLGRFTNAIKYIERAQKLGVKLNDDGILETALINLGDAYLSLKMPAKYMPAYKAALPLAEKTGDISGKCFALDGISLGLFFQQQYGQAETLLKTSIAFARQHDQKEVWSRMLLLMSDVQIGLGRPVTSQDFRAQYDSVSNVLLNAPMLKNIQELEARYGAERKQRQLLEKDLQLGRKQRLLVISLAGLAVLALVFVLVYRNYQTLRAQQETLRVKAILAGEQQERRRISREMHDDMGSGLTRLLFLTRTLFAGHEAAPKISDAINGLIRKMNEVVWMMNNERDTLESLVAYVRAACGEMLDAAGINMIFNVHGTLPDITLSQEVRRNMYLAVKEAVNNAVRHSEAKSVSISILANSDLVVTIRDNGRGFDASEQALGNGLVNMRQRLESIGGTMDLASNDGTRIQFAAALRI